MKTLAIEREFGSGGREIGMKVADMAGIPYYDSNLLIEAAKAHGLSAEMMKDYDEQKTGSLLYSLAMNTGYTQSAQQTKEYEFFYEIQETMKRLMREGPTVFIGRCSTEILKYQPHVLRVYVYCSDERKKMNRIMRVENLASESEARKLREKKDRNRKNYFKFWTQKEWNDRNNYDMELNTGMLSADECAQILLRAMTE